MPSPELTLPSTPACLAAVDVATNYHSAAMLNHCIRSYLWAADHGRRNGLAFDDELLFVSALLHDIGLVTEFDNYTLPFENAGGQVAWVFGAGAGWPRERRARAAEIIVRHMWDEVDPALDPEGFLLCIATGLDISGRNAEEWPADFRAEVVEAYPRLTLAEEFVRCFAEQADRKPLSSAADAIASGVAGRLDANPLDTRRNG
ncbi:HD domain-containing protein [Herbiconiux daphne]|uniref:HD domain-containing protein n=1 Tax=Herbiconiux daphne TaxID=2970914 RepID=A0ABT2H889_9MICO|nr:HD domain-containing protein [Herbiconiux daphne]MCS5736136.1 HD domain-containing protein [Herbiconiux daphne]